MRTSGRMAGELYKNRRSYLFEKKLARLSVSIKLRDFFLALYDTQ